MSKIASRSCTAAGAAAVSVSALLAIASSFRGLGVEGEKRIFAASSMVELSAEWRTFGIATRRLMIRKQSIWMKNGLLAVTQL
jgi:hypothetical protein